LLPAGEEARIRERWLLAVESATRFAEEFRYSHPDGSPLWMRAEAGPLRDARPHQRLHRHHAGRHRVPRAGQPQRIPRQPRRPHLLLNRDRFERHLRAAISGAREVTDRLALLFIDLDDFKASMTPTATRPATRC
jgi:hypothetical protein